jgi:hypothetical protein
VRLTRDLSRLILAAPVGVACAALLSGTTASASSTIPAFSASAAASGAIVELSSPGAILSNQIVDVSGPKAQVAVNTIGASTGFAALPDPGDVVRGAPGLVTGLLSLGVAGLPPIRLPQLPSYPLAVTSNAQNNPDASEGAGPYALSAHSTPTSSTAAATGGLVSPVTGNIAALQSTASLTSSADAVTATATSTLDGLTVGPLTLGTISSTATESRDSDGTITPSSSLTITGAAIGGISVSLGPNGLVAVSQKLNLPVDKTLDKLLAGAKIKTSVEPARTFAHRIVAPALVITMPVPVKLGLKDGTFTLTIGSTTASLLANPAGLGPLTPPTSPTPTGTTPGGGIPVGSTTGTGTGTGTIPSGSIPGLGAASGGSGAGGTPPVTAPNTGSSSSAATRAIALSEPFDLRSVYLLLGLVAAVLLAAAPFYRLLMGLRWTSRD